MGGIFNICITGKKFTLNFAENPHIFRIFISVVANLADLIIPRFRPDFYPLVSLRYSANPS